MNALIRTPFNPPAAVDMAPVRVVLYGTTTTEKKLSVIQSGSAATALFFANAKGKVGQVARESISTMGISRMVREVRTGNYRSVAESLAVLLGQSIILSNRASWDAMPDRLAGMLADLKDGGYKTNKDGVDVPVAKRVAIESAAALIESVTEGVAALLASEAAEKAAAEAKLTEKAAA